MLENLPQMLGIEPGMIKSNDEDLDTQEKVSQSSKGMNFSGLYMQKLGERHIDTHGFLNFGQQNHQQEEVPIVLDVYAAKNQEYAGGGFKVDLETKLEQYGIKKSEYNKENKFSLIAIEQLMKILNDSTLIDHHTTILRGINYIVSKIGKDATQFLPLIIPSILNGISVEDETNIANL
jgi:hypothetical protein